MGSGGAIVGDVGSELQQKGEQEKGEEEEDKEGILKARRAGTEASRLGQVRARGREGRWKGGAGRVLGQGVGKGGSGRV